MTGETQGGMGGQTAQIAAGGSIPVNVSILIAPRVAPRNVTLVWFDDLSHEPLETADTPDALRVVADDLGRSVRDGSAGPAKGEIRLSAKCYTHSIDRADGLPEIVVNFTSEEPQSFSKGLTISGPLGKYGCWMRNDGTGCAWRDCAMILFGKK